MSRRLTGAFAVSSRCTGKAEEGRAAAHASGGTTGGPERARGRRTGSRNAALPPPLPPEPPPVLAPPVLKLKATRAEAPATADRSARSEISTGADAPPEPVTPPERADRRRNPVGSPPVPGIGRAARAPSDLPPRRCRRRFRTVLTEPAVAWQPEALHARTTRSQHDEGE